MTNLTQPVPKKRECITVRINQNRALNQITLDYRLNEFYEDLQVELKGDCEDSIKQAARLRKFSDDMQHNYCVLIHRLIWQEGAGHANKRAFMKFLQYHDVQAQSVHNRCIFLPRYKMPNQQKADRLVFMDDGTVTIIPKHDKFSVNVRYYESRHFYKKLARYIGIPDLEVVHRL
ncbi:hypothetical protein [Chitinophaga arvensicola]|uniref:Uncharacterized protein n=1 Tax=Chitinophaga arvensicola TaxID=29529 RepID=A0A1I0S5V8_9BACT|nr:hypothetical protein [Chitinophaga arvensicola]SEW50627.1 hypothetical protein SAMN04488122_3898 [Chitinophaga arvensicola]